MPRHITLDPHLSVVELQQRYRQADDPVERTHFQMLWLLGSGRTTAQVAEVIGYSPHWVRQLVARYNHSGPDAMGDRRQKNPGGRPLLSPEQRAELDQALAQPPGDGGLWDSRKVADWMASRTGRTVSPQRGWDYLRLLGYSPQVPRPRHRKADADAQEQFKKNAAAVRSAG